MAMRQCFFLHVSAPGLILLAIWPNGLLALGFFEAGKSSFSPLQESSFWKSDGGNYTFGFQAVDGGTDYLLSIWLSDDPNKMAIWWPPVSSNGADPTVKEDAFFQFTSNGNLDLYSPLYKHPLWSSNTTSSYAKLEDTGNLMLFADSSESAVSLWQSFEHSQNSLMLAAELDTINVTSVSSLLQSRRNSSSYAIGRFYLQTHADDEVELHGKDYLHNIDFKYATVTMNTVGGFWISNHIANYSSDSFDGIERLTLDYTGNLKIYHWNSSTRSWMMAWQISDNKCMVGSPCGPFGICQSMAPNGNAICSCPTGYKAKVADDPSQGCENPIISQEICNLTDITMEKVLDADYHLNDLKSEKGLQSENCTQICLKDCECLAFVHTYTGDGATDTSVDMCYFKSGLATRGYLMNGYNSPGKTLYIKVMPYTHKKKWNWVIGVGVAATVLVVVVLGACWRLRRNNGSFVLPLGMRRHKFEVAGDVGQVRFYRYDELVLATANFSEPLGKGGFGTVFKGRLAVQNTRFDYISTEETYLRSNVDDKDQQMRVVAVKVLREYGGKGDVDAQNESYSQFRAEINTLGKIHHVNLVSLLGYSYNITRAHTENARMLVYECMEKGSLDKYLSRAQDAKPNLTWGVRYSIALGIARGIAYLHHDCNPPILHCDIKPHNILLDDNFIAKVADFGFARRIHLQHPHGHIILSSVRGTHGYLAPEWLTSDEITFKVDVYSFGKLLLELVRGFKLADDGLNMPLVEWAIECMSQGAVVEFSECPDVENSLEFLPLPLRHENHDSQQEAIEKLRLLKVGMWCIQQKFDMRPTMSHVVQLIEGTITMENPPIPTIPLKTPISSFSATTSHVSSVSGR